MRSATLVLVCVALMLALMVIPEAQAQSCSSFAQQCTEGAAYAVCRAELASYIASRAPTQFRNDRCEKKFATSTNVITSKFEYENRGSWVSGIYRDYYYTRGCSTEPPYTGTGPWSTDRAARSGSLGCRNGCDGMWSSNVDGTKTWTGTGGICPEDQEGNCKAPSMASQGYFWNPILNVCEPPEGKCPGGGKVNSLGQCGPEPCPDGMAQQADGTCKKKDEECPAGQVRSPDGKCLPGDGQCAKGEVRGKDGTCKRDRDEDGNPDEGEEPDDDSGENFAGGDDCKSPPSCSGSPILCGQARIQWRIDCNTRRNRNIAGGMCTQPPICTGEKCDALEYSGLLMQWRTACAVEKLAQGNGGNGSNGDLTAIRDALTGTSGNADPGESLPGSGAWQGGGSGSDPIEPDTSGYGWGGGSCPALPAIDVMGATIQFDPTPLCNWLSLGSYFVMGLAALASLRIVATKDA